MKLTPQQFEEHASDILQTTYAGMEREVHLLLEEIKGKLRLVQENREQWDLFSKE